MEKRIIIAIVLCAAILFGWSMFSSKLFPPPAAPPSPAPTAPAAPVPPAPSAPVAGQAPGAAPAHEAAAATASAAVAGHAEREVELLTPAVRFVLSNRGGTLRRAQLREGKFLLHAGDPDSGLDIVRTTQVDHAALRTTFPQSAFPTPPDDAWDVTQPAPDVVVFTADTPTARIVKRFRADTTRYRLHLDVTVENKTAEPAGGHLAVHLFARQDPNAKGGGFFSGGSANLASILCQVNDKVERTTVEKLAKEQVQKVGTVRWLGADEKFFLLAAVPYPETPARERTCTERSQGPEIGEGILSFAEREIPAHGSTSYAFSVYAGPKFITDLEAVRPGGEDAKLADAVDVTLAVLSRPILSLLKIFYGIAHNWGVAIILLTLFIKLLTFYPTQRSLLSAKKMQKLGPKMAAIRKKYENDRQRQSVETMNLYKAHGVSPFGGCLPSLIQMPIWIALYSTLNYAVELYRSPFVFHIRDLTAKDPFYVTPLLMGGVMFLQMKMSPASPDNQQQAMMSVMMPVMFTAFSLVLPSGLALYMLTSYLIGILQQLYVNYVDRRSNARAAA
jgi:YidC/Oxa1 family membrane protein insertase